MNIWNLESILAITSTLTAICTLVITYILYNKQQEPEVIVYLVPSNTNKSINLIVENIGNGIARNITFNSNKPIPKSACGWEKTGNRIDYFDDGIFIKGIQFFLPKNKRNFQWGDYWALKEALGDGTIEIETNYQSFRLGGLYKKKHKAVSVIDVSSFRYVDASNHEINVVDSLKNIRKELENNIRKNNQNMLKLNHNLEHLLVMNKKTKRVWEKNHDLNPYRNR